MTESPQPSRASDHSAEAPHQPTRPSGAWRIVRTVLLAIGTALLLLWLVLYITKGRFLKHPFERVATATLDRQVEVPGDFQLYFDPIDLHFVAEGMTIANPGWASRPHLFVARRIDTHIETVPLLFGARRVTTLDLRDGAIDLEWDKAGGRNSWTFSDHGKPFVMPTIREAIVQGTTLRYVDPRLALSADIAFKTIEAADTRFASTIQFTGNGRARATPFALSGALLTPNATAEGGRNRLVMHVHAARTRIEIAGTLRGPTQLEGADLRVSARGRNIADLFGVAGIAVPQTRDYRLDSALTKRGDEYRFTHLRGRFGDSDLAGTLTVAAIAPRIKLTADLSTRSLDIADVAPAIGYDPDAAAKGPQAVVKRIGGTPRILPDAPLRVESIKTFDADVHYRVRQIKSRNVPVSAIDLTLTLDNGLLTLSPLTFDMARGHVASDITINARRPLVHTDYDIRLSPTPMGILLAGYGVEQSGTTGMLKARIKMAGDGNSVHASLASADGRIAIIIPKGAFWTRNVQLSELDIGTFVQKLIEGKLKEPVQINCGLIGFTVRDGVAAADPILIDTQKNVIVGRGGFSFKTEAIDLAVRADGKKFSLISAQSPVALNGYFARPGIDVISPQLIGRAGASIALGLAFSPLASVLAFVDIGDAKAARCGPVLAGATALAQRTTKGRPRDDVGHGTTAKAESGRKSPTEKNRQRKKFLGIF
ncbi:MAG: AsmA family protein [Sphingomonas sp. 28-62-20]|uniref:AsmA family protein n=1 Tax=Sphingomonas sp. 28-62-20 TaxID=1970433 RepID=UPI000BD75839|nr:MAG: AsmA family protein [Sphingomonas sp. 28-62-20]